MIKSANSIRTQNNIEYDVIEEKKYLDRLIVHYTHEKRLQTYKREIHQIWNQLFFNTPALEVRLIIGNKNSRNIRRELIRTCPLPSVLFGTKIQHTEMIADHWTQLLPTID